MAQLEDPQPLPKATLISELDRARNDLKLHASRIRARANPVAIFQRSLASHPLVWLGGAFILVRLFTGRSSRRQKTFADSPAANASDTAKTGLLLGALKLGFDLGKPFLMSWASSRLEKMARNPQPRQKQEQPQ